MVQDDSPENENPTDDADAGPPPDADLDDADAGLPPDADLDDDDLDDGAGSGGSFFGGSKAIPLIGGVAVIVVAFVIFLLIGLAGGGGDDDSSASVNPTGASGGLAGTRTPGATPVATLDLTRPTVVPTIDPNAPLPGETEGDKIVISRFGIDAPLTLKIVGANGVMPNPEGPDDVAFYDFDRQFWPTLGGVPGFGGNVVLAGHVDWGAQHGFGCKNDTVPPPCTAVFWDVSQLNVGDEIEIHYNGEVYRYKVTSNESIPADSAPWDQIVAATDQETITLITCGGDFNRSTSTYNNRQVIAGVRVTT